MRGKRLLFWCLACVAVGATFAWILYVPYKPERVLSAIPQESTFVSLHANLAGELPALLENRVVTGTLSAAGTSATELSGLVTNRDTRVWLQRLAGDKTAIAYVPSLGSTRKPAWVCASWIGNQSQILRWKVTLFHPRNFKPVAFEYGRTIYNVRMRLENPRQCVSVALLEGILVACLSEDPTAARYLVQTFDRQYGRRPFTPSTQALGTGSFPSSDRPHQGWLRLPGSPLPDQPANSTLLCDARCPDRDHLELRLAIPGSLPDASADTGNATARTLSALLGNSPDCTWVMPASWLRAVIFNSQAMPLWVESLNPLMDSNRTNALAFAAILNREHCGRIRGPISDTLTPFLKGLRVPTLVFAIQATDSKEAASRIMKTLDRLNSRYGLGLIPHNLQTAAGGLTLIEETRRNLYGRFEPDERIAWTFRDGWLIVFSNAAVLKRRLATPADDASLSLPAWKTLLEPADSAAWFNIPRTTRLFKDAIAAITLSLVFRNPEGTRETRAKLDVAGQWMSRLADLGEAATTIRATNGWVMIELDAAAAVSSH